MAEVWMNKWSLVVETENSKLCVTRSRGKEKTAFVKEGKMRSPDERSRRHIALWRHLMFKE
ncbi:hypothetical protein A9K97_gp160 [Tokyovirus A1]|uniref:hypothetical protein n=1 Tax=Tokyovirus A1 TaxID=1826170 RepID=UPI0007A964CA|nr:hypothetical protein A9K97_gp160 [Tokyovirus A1]BAU80191.1 hypothetical protein [Tokyovirus A1]